LGKPADTSLAADATECFYRAALDHALVYLGSRILYPARPAVRETDYYALYSEPREAVERRSLYSYREDLEMLDVLLFHKDYEVNHKRYVQQPALMQAALQFTGEKFDFVTRELGLMLGSQIYEAYVAGHFGRRSLRALLAGGNVRRASATALYFKLARRVGKPGESW
jgi:hypothetical protein